FRAFDDKNWPALRACLCEEVFVDSSSARIEPASRIPSDRYVERRRNALRNLDVQHSFLNLRVEMDAAGKTAKARCSSLVYRLQGSSVGFGRSYLHSCGRCDFAFAMIEGEWKISGIAQNLMPDALAARSPKRETLGNDRLQDTLMVP